MSSNEFTSEDWRRLIKDLGENPDRPGLRETPERVAKAWHHWTSGYDQDPNEILKVFEDGAENYNELIVVRGIPVYSHCEHHLAPFFGIATIGYTPAGRIVGLSKLTRLVDCFAKRLQVQERLTMQVADALTEHLKPRAVGVVIRCRHMCMESRGIRTPRRRNRDLSTDRRTAYQSWTAHRILRAGARTHLALGYSGVRPLITRSRIRTTAITSRMWMKPPRV